MPSLRPQDSANERVVADFLDRFVYGLLGLRHERIDDRERQLNGVDVVLHWPAANPTMTLKVDEKAATHYVNENLPTFAFEIDWLAEGGEKRCGWLLAEGSETECYCLVWLWARPAKPLTVEGIFRVHVCIVRRDAVLDLLKRHGLTSDRLRQKAWDARASVEGWREGPEGIRFSLSDHLDERPVNVVVPKHMLVAAALWAYDVWPGPDGRVRSLK
jgi:hypothetical protein